MWGWRVLLLVQVGGQVLQARLLVHQRPHQAWQEMQVQQFLPLDAAVVVLLVLVMTLQ
jgi:hypothetical protein